MRRIGQQETLHGTRDGQLAVDESLAQRFGLTERESACAALLKLGGSTQEIADRLEVSPSTAEKHLVALRRKLGVSTTLEAAVYLFRLENEATARIPDAYGVVLPFSGPGGPGALENPSSTEAFVAGLRGATTLEEMLDLVLGELEEEGVAALFYYLLPLAAASFRKGDILMRSSGSRTLVDALRADNGATQAYAAGRLFHEPDLAVTIRLDKARAPEVSTIVANACRAASIRESVTLGSPFGTGYVVLSALYRRHASPGEADPTRRERILRNRLLLLQNVAYSFGALARSARLTTRERDALTFVAAGHSTRSAAEAVGTSERAFGQLLKSAREKLRADTTAEAVAKAMALNALVFL